MVGYPISYRVFYTSQVVQDFWTMKSIIQTSFRWWEDSAIFCAEKPYRGCNGNRRPKSLPKAGGGGPGTRTKTEGSDELASFLLFIDMKCGLDLYTLIKICMSWLHCKTDISMCIPKFGSLCTRKSFTRIILEKKGTKTNTFFVWFWELP